MVNGMKIENIPLFIAFFVLILFVVFGQKFLAEYFFAKMSEALSNDDFVSFDEATKDADLILILCDHNEFKNPNYNLISKNMKNPIIFDTKNIISKVPDGIKLYNYGNLYKLN